MELDPLARTLIRAWEILEEIEVSAAVMGGVALAAWNHPRFTHDVDLLLALPETEKGPAVANTLPGVEREIAVVACEDMIILKLLAGRIIDRADAAALLRKNRRRLDDAYLLNWIKAHSLQSPFAEIWDEAFPGEHPPG